MIWLSNINSDSRSIDFTIRSLRGDSSTRKMHKEDEEDCESEREVGCL